jgi:hypothetical protein
MRLSSVIAAPSAAALTLSMLAASVLGCGVVRAQVANFPPGTPKAVPWSKLPTDWDGIWERGGPLGWNQSYPPTAPEQRPPYNAQYLEKLKVRLAAQHRIHEVQGVAYTYYDSPRAGVMPGMMMAEFGLNIEVNSREVAIWSPSSADPREIYTDGRLQPLHPFPSTKGHSIGHWEGGALVVDTCCFRADTPLPDYGPHSDAMHIIERIWSPRPGELEDHVVVTDPEAFTHPWATTFAYYHRPNWEEVEDDTSQNDRPLPKPGQQVVISPSELKALLSGAASAGSQAASAASAAPAHTFCDLSETPCTGEAVTAGRPVVDPSDTETLQKLSELGGLGGLSWAWETIGISDVHVTPNRISWKAGSAFLKGDCTAARDGASPTCHMKRPVLNGLGFPGQHPHRRPPGA